MANRLEHLKLNQIECGDIALRPAEVESAEFKQLTDSIKQFGILQSIVVRVSPDHPDKFNLIDGLQRFTIAGLLGMDTIPAQVLDANEAQVMRVQIQTNLQRVTTKPAAYGKQIRRLMALDPALTVTKIAHDLGTSVTWVNQRINLHTLLPEIAELVDAGNICATNAFVLAKLPAEEQKVWVGRAAKDSPEVFVDQCLARYKEIKDAIATGKAPKDEQFISVKRLRPVATIKEEFETHAARAQLLNDKMTLVQAFDMAVAWVLHQDPPTVQIEREKWEAEKAARDAAREKRAAELEAKKQAKAEAAEKAAADARAAVTK